jgi:hypothetical protein
LIGRGTADTLWQETAAIQQLIKNEIHAVHEQQRELRTQGQTGYITIIILLLCIFLNVAFLLMLKDYFALFITASFYMFMIYFITLLVPIGAGVQSFRLERIRQFFSTLYHNGIISTTDRFTHIFLDVFLINSRVLFQGFLIVFLCDLVFATIAFIKGDFSTWTTVVIMFQSISIILFYFLVWRFEPYSTKFQTGVQGLKDMFINRRYPAWIITLTFSTAALLLLFAILSTIILLPGFTVKTLLTLTGLENLGNFVFLIVILIMSQYFVVRFFHGISSERMATQFSDAKIGHLQLLQKGYPATPSTSNGSLENQSPSTDEIREVTSGLLKSKIYHVEVRDIYGLFPVFIVNPDFSVILDEQMIKIITGYFQHVGSSGIDRR